MTDNAIYCMSTLSVCRLFFFFFHCLLLYCPAASKPDLLSSKLIWDSLQVSNNGTLPMKKKEKALQGTVTSSLTFITLVFPHRYTPPRDLLLAIVSHWLLIWANLTDSVGGRASQSVSVYVQAWTLKSATGQIDSDQKHVFGTWF